MTNIVGINGKELAEQFYIMDVDVKGAATQVPIRTMTDVQLGQYVKFADSQLNDAQQRLLQAVEDIARLSRVKASIEYETDCRARRLHIFGALPS